MIDFIYEAFAWLAGGSILALLVVGFVMACELFEDLHDGN